MTQPRSHPRRSVISFVVLVTLCAGLSTATVNPASAQSSAQSSIGDHLSKGGTMFPGQWIENRNHYRLVFDNGGHAILISPGGKHCASWPAPSSVHPSAHLLFNNSAYVQLINASGAQYATIGSANHGTTLNISPLDNHLYVGSQDVHGC